MQTIFGMPGAFRSEALTTKLIARNISSTCNSSGSEIWASAKNIKPLVDTNCHTEAIEFGYQQSAIRFSPIHYRNPGSQSRPPGGQAILFGCPLELCTVGELTKIPPVLEYLLDSVHGWRPDHVIWHSHANTGDTSTSLYCEMEHCWPLANELERAWTGVEETDRALTSKFTSQDRNRMLLVMVCPLRCTIQRLSDFVGIFYGPSKAGMDRQ